MDLKIRKNDIDAKRDFFSLQTKYEVATLLEVPFSVVIYLLYRIDRPKAYKKFEIKKKSGGIREIYAPVSSLKILQRKLSYILYLIYKPRLPVYGFCKDKNIIGNAHLHVKKKLVLNIDLEDFFPTIHIGRVIGLFRSRPFNFPKEVATVLAQICCFDGKLPQGAPTSPVIANMICAGLDKDLQALAKQYHCVYTRYADDITFSTTAKSFNDDIALYENGILICGNKISEIIKRHNFKINVNKVRLRSPKERQEVTGLIVNEFVNVPRKMIKEILGMLNAWRVYGEDQALQYFYLKYGGKNIEADRQNSSFQDIVLGKISFIKSVRGEKDKIYRKLINQYNKIKYPGNTALQLPIDFIDELKSSLWVVKTSAGYAGTAFMLEGELVTCEHVVHGSPKFDVIHWQTQKKYEAIVGRKSAIADMAVIDIQGIQPGDAFFSLDKNSTRSLREKDVLSVMGFPDYRPGDAPQYWDAKIGSKNIDLTQGEGIYVEKFCVDRPLYGGMSGSPMIDKNNKVIGIAVYGAPTVKEATHIWDYGFIPIHYLDGIA